MFSTVLILKILGLTLKILSVLGMKDNFNKAITDISKDCINNYSANIHLTYNSGESDAKILILRGAASLRRNCFIYVAGPEDKLCSDKKCVVMAAVDFINQNLSATSCKFILGEITLVSHGHDHLLADVCGDINNNRNNIKNNVGQQTHTSLINKSGFVINLNFSGFSGTVKITVASAKYLGNQKYCSRDSVIKCVLKSQALCIKKRLVCEGNVDCENSDSYDEQCKDENTRSKVGTVLYGFFLIAVLLYFFIHLLQAYLSNVSEYYFVFNEDNDNKFVPASQSLPPLRIEEEEEEIALHDWTTNRRY